MTYIIDGPPCDDDNSEVPWQNTIKPAKEMAKLIQFDYGDRVKFDVSKSGDEGIVGHIILSPQGIMYSVTWSDKSVKDHYGFELKKVTK
jgi:hypothetical protein